MREQDVKVSTTSKINLLLLQGFMSGAAALYLWPELLIDWGWGFISILLWVSCLGSLLRALIEIYKAYNRDRKIEAFLAQGSKPKSSGLASTDDLRKAGMIK